MINEEIRRGKNLSVYSCHFHEWSKRKKLSSRIYKFIRIMDNVFVKRLANLKSNSLLFSKRLPNSISRPISHPKVISNLKFQIKRGIRARKIRRPIAQAGDKEGAKGSRWAHFRSRLSSAAIPTRSARNLTAGWCISNDLVAGRATCAILLLVAALLAA